MGTPDDAISATIDISDVNGAKFDALEAHASQIADSFWMKMGRERFIETMRTEWFVRVTNPKNLEATLTTSSRAIARPDTSPRVTRKTPSLRP